MSRKESDLAMGLHTIRICKYMVYIYIYVYIYMYRITYSFIYLSMYTYIFSLSVYIYIEREREGSEKVRSLYHCGLWAGIHTKVFLQVQIP